MAEVKDRGVDSPVASEEAEVCTQKFVNLGKSVELSNGETVVVKDISLDAWMEGLAKLLPSLMALADSSMDQTQMMVTLLGTPNLRNALMTLIAHAIDRPVAEVKKFNPQDAIKIMLAAKEVVDFKEINELFTQLVPQAKDLPSSTGSLAKPASPA